MRKAPNHRALAALALAVFFLVGTVASRAIYSSCRNEPSSPSGAAVHAGSQDSYVWVPGTVTAGVDLEGLSGDGAKACINRPGSANRVKVTQRDAKEGAGKRVAVGRCERGETSGCSVVADETAGTASVPEPPDPPSATPPDVPPGS